MRIVDQDNKPLYGKATMKTGYQDFVGQNYVIEFSSPIKYDLSELEIIVEAAGKKKEIKPNSMMMTVKFDIPKAPPPAKPTPSPVPPARKEISVLDRKQITVVERQQVESDHNEEPQDLPDDVIELDPDEEINMAFESIANQHQTDLTRKILAEMGRKDTGQVVQNVKSIARLLNARLREKVEGQKTYEVTDKRAGPLSIRDTLETFPENPTLKYVNVIDRRPPKCCNIFLDISESTNTPVRSFDGTYTTIKHSLLLAALSIAEVFAEMDGEARIVLFSDKDNVDHGRVVKYDKTTRRRATEQLLDLHPCGGTRLDEVLLKVEALNRTKKADSTFILLDGAPMFGYYQVDVDDNIQQQAISQLRTIEKTNQVFILWASSPNNKPEYDQFFFNRCKVELEKTAVVNVKSFALFAKQAHMIWQMPPRRDRPPSAHSSDLVYPFELDALAKADADKLNVPGDAEGTVEKIKIWILHGFKYSFPYHRRYRIALEVYEAREGCCGEISNMLVGILRYLGIPCCIAEIQYVHQVRVNHACVSAAIGDKQVLLDMTMGSITSKDSIGNPVSDARWARLINYWRLDPMIIKDRN